MLGKMLTGGKHRKHLQGLIAILGTRASAEQQTLNRIDATMHLPELLQNGECLWIVTVLHQQERQATLKIGCKPTAALQKTKQPSETLATSSAHQLIGHQANPLQQW